jgi:hypothetical protein
MEHAELTLHVEATEQIRAGNLKPWAETARRQRRKDPTALAMLVGAVLSRPHPEIAERLLAIALDQHQDTHVAIRPSRVGSLRPLRSRPSHRLRLRRPTGTSRITSRRSATR